MEKFEKKISAIKDINELHTLKESVENLFASQEKYINMLNKANEMSASNFGFIKEAFETISPALYQIDGGKEIIKKYIAEINSNASLRKLYHIYENIYHASKDIDIDFLINKSFVSSLDKKNLKEGKEKVAKIFIEGYFALNGDMDSSSIKSNDTLNESIEYLATASESMKTLGKRSECVKNIKDFLSENAGKNVRVQNTDVTDADAILENYQEKYNAENDLDVVKEILGAKDKSLVFENYKSHCIEAITKQIEANSTDINIDRLSSLLESIEKKNYNENTIGTDIANFIEITELVNE